MNKKNPYQPKWRPTLPVDAYVLALTGAKDQDIATALNVTDVLFCNWKKKHPELAYALEKAREQKKQTETQSFEDYVYGRLPKELQQLWDKIAYWFDHAEGYERIHAILHTQPTRIRQCLWIHAMIASNFNASEASFRVCVPRKELLSWEDDPQFAALMDELQYHKQNFYEGALADLTAMRNPLAVIFANKTLNKSRGYSEKLTVEHTGTIVHRHSHVVSVDKLNLSFETRCQLLDAVRAAKQVEQVKEEAGETEEGDNKAA